MRFFAGQYLPRISGSLHEGNGATFALTTAARGHRRRSGPGFSTKSVDSGGSIEAQKGVALLAVTCRLQLRKFTPVNVRSNLCTPVHKSSRPRFVHSREPA